MDSRQLKKYFVSRLAGLFILAITILIMLWIMTHMPGDSYQGELPPLSLTEKKIAEYLKQHVVCLAKTIGSRNIFEYEGLNKAAEYIENIFKQIGYEIKEQKFLVEGKEVKNLEVEIRGSEYPEEIIIVGAHYDSVSGCPAANDNASGVAGLLELSRLLLKEKLKKTIRLVAFVNEEPPFFQTENMGSWVYAKRAKERKEKIIGMISLETIGYYSSQKGSQSYPFPFNFLYPETGDFIGFVSNIRSGKFLRHCLNSFRRNTRFPSEGVSAPGFIVGVGWSDHWSFWQEGFSAIMLTDTALFRYPYYHTTQDTVDKLHFSPMSQVISGVRQMVIDLSNT